MDSIEMDLVGPNRSSIWASIRASDWEMIFCCPASNCDIIFCFSAAERDHLDPEKTADPQPAFFKCIPRNLPETVTSISDEGSPMSLPNHQVGTGISNLPALVDRVAILPWRMCHSRARVSGKNSMVSPQTSKTSASVTARRLDIRCKLAPRPIERPRARERFRYRYRLINSVGNPITSKTARITVPGSLRNTGAPQ